MQKMHIKLTSQHADKERSSIQSFEKHICTNLFTAYFRVGPVFPLYTDASQAYGMNILNVVDLGYNSFTLTDI